MDQYTVQNTNRINWVLQSLCDEHQLVDIDYPRKSLGGRSIVVNVNSKEGFYYLDRLQSNEAHQQAISGNAFNVKSILRGVEICIFRVEIDRLIKDAKGDLYRIKIPEELQYVQKREHYRVKVRGDDNIRAHLTIHSEQDEEEEILAPTELLDLSAGGCKLSINIDKDDVSFNPGDEFSLKLDLPDEKAPVFVSAICRYVVYLKRFNAWQIGCSFSNLDKTSQKIIIHLVTELQRVDRKAAALFS